MNAALPRLFVIGDSISIQYGPHLERLAAGHFAYDRKQDSAGAPRAASNLDTPTGANGGDSDMVLAYLRHRRAHNPIAADILLFNCGLHDIKTDPATGGIQVPLDRYEKNLRAILAEAAQMNLHPVWVRTTPVIDANHNRLSSTFHRFAKDVASYNAVADAVMAGAGVTVIDLHAFSEPLLPAGFADHVHYTDEVRRKQAAFIFDALRAAAPAPRPNLRFRLWDGPAPGVALDAGPEKEMPGNRISNITVPMLDVYLPAPGKATGAAIIVFSGGGYRQLAPGPRGSGAAFRFLPHGITVFSLKYRLTPPSAHVLRDALADAARAVRTVRARAGEWGVDPHRIAVIGLSAGANLALNLALNADSGDPASPDPIERQNSRPDFLGLCCTWPYNQEPDDFKITADAPPAYFVHARDDTTAPLGFAEAVSAAWQRAGAVTHLEIYATGGHSAFGMPNETATDWPGKFLRWMESLPVA